MKAITDALDSIANVGTPNNPYIRLPRDIVNPCVDFTFTLYRHLFFPPPQLELVSFRKQYMDQFDSHTESLQKSLGPKIVLPSEEEEERKKEAERILFETCPRLHYTQREGVKVLIDGKKKGFHAILNKLAIEERLSAIYVSRKPKSFKIFHYFSDKEIDALETYAKTLYGKVLLTEAGKHKRKAEKELFKSLSRVTSLRSIENQLYIKELIDNNKEEELAEKLLIIDFYGNPRHFSLQSGREKQADNLSRKRGFSQNPQHYFADDEIAAFETYAKTLHGEVLFTEEEKSWRKNQRLYGLNPGPLN